MKKSRVYTGPILILGAVQLIESIAIALPMSFFPNYVISLGASVASVGLFTSSFMIASAFLSPKMGSLTDKYGRKKLLILGIGSDVILGILTGLVPSWEWLLLVRLLNGAVSSAAMLASETLLYDTVDPARRGEASGFIMSMGGIGRNIGPLLGGSIQWYSMSRGTTELMSFRIPYFVDSAFALVALVIVFLKITEPETRMPRMMRMKGQKADSSEFKLSREIKILLVNGFVSGIGMGFIMPIMVLFYTDKFGTSSVQIGAIFSISGFIGLFASWVAGRFSDRLGRKPLIALGNYSSRAMGLAIPLMPDITSTAIVQSIRSLGFNIGMPAFRALRADLVPANMRGRVFGLFSTSFTAGSVLGPIISTWIYSTYRSQVFHLMGLSFPGYGIPFFINAILGLLSTTMIMLFVEEPRKYGLVEEQ
jgi:DHA1 family multidrug resistance protein-like MFS transporter